MKKVLTNINDFQDLVNYAAKKYRSKTAMQIRRRVLLEKVSYQDLPRIINQLIKFFEVQKINPGDKILLWGLNCPEYATLVMAIFISGRTAVPIDFRTKDETVVKIISQTGSKVAFVSGLVNTRQIHQQIKQVYVIEEMFEKISQFEAKNNLDYKIDKQYPSEILYTSGTTGDPKGVIIEQTQIVAITKVAQTYIPKLKDYRTISILPLSHVLEQIIGTAIALSLGTTTTYLTRINSFKLKAAMQEFKPTYLVFVPQLLSVFWQRVETEAHGHNKLELLNKLFLIAKYLPKFLRARLFKQIRQAFGGELQFIACSGAPLSKELASKYLSMGFKLIEIYGATEVLAATINNNPKDIGTVGKAIAGVQIKISTENEILIKGKYLTSGYFKNPQKNQATFIDGWYKTGDMGTLDQQGRLSILGRDSFKLVLTNGENIYVEDLENKINAHPLVRNSCVIGVDDQGADQIHVFVIPKQKLTDKQLAATIREINQTLSSKQQILSYAIWQADDFPRSHTLKVDRRQVKESFTKKAFDPTQSTASNNIQLPTLNDLIARVAKTTMQKIKPNQLLSTDLMIDSLGRAELVALIEEELGIVIDSLQVNEQTTVSELTKLVNKTDNIKPINYPIWQYNRFYTLLRLFIFKLFIFPIHGFFARLKYDSATKVTAKQLENTIVICNHPGLFDVIAVLRTLGNQSAKAVSLASHDFWNHPIKKIIELGGGFPLDQNGNNLLKQLQILAGLLEKGHFLLLAPQGTMQRSLIPNKFKQGIGFLVKELHLSILPIKLVDYEKVWAAPPMAIKDMTKSDWKDFIRPKKRGNVVVKIGEQLKFDNKLSSDQITKQVEDYFIKL